MSLTWDVFWRGVFTSVLLPLLVMFVVCRRRKRSSLENFMQQSALIDKNEDMGRQHRKKIFLATSAGKYGYESSPAGHIDAWRAKEHPNLYSIGNTSGDVYLDWAGSALPTMSQLQPDATVHGNPHSTGPSAYRSAQAMDQTKKLLLDHFHGNPGRYAGHEASAPAGTPLSELHPGYDVVFTSGTTESCRIVAEYFDWSRCRHCRRSSLFVVTQNNHTSVIGMRGPALARGATYACCPSLDVDAIVETLGRTISEPCSHCRDLRMLSLVAIPLESNFDGARFDATTWKEARGAVQNTRLGSVYTMLDIAKAASTCDINLCDLDADFYGVSLYKLFGEPTGLGCLFVKRSSISSLVLLEQKGPLRHYFGGGSVDMLVTSDDAVFQRPGLAALNNGSAHFRGIASVKYGFDVIKRMGGMRAIQQHASCLADELDRRLRGLLHANGATVVHIYSSERSTRAIGGPTVTFNLCRSDGTTVGYNEVSKLAALHRPPIQMRTGCFCNPGACQLALGLSNDDIRDNYVSRGHRCGDDVDIIDGRPTGAIRASFGKDSTWEDLDILVSFISRLYVDSVPMATPDDASTRWDGGPREVVVSEIFIYPIKSCAAQRVAAWKFNKRTGRPLFDREFALVDSFGHAMRLQNHSKMVRISPEVDLEQMILKVSARGHGTISIDLSSSMNDMAVGKDVRVCGKKCEASLCGDDMSASDWFSDVLGVRCWLASHRSNYRSTDGRLRDHGVAFANEKPLLLISEHAVDLLNDVLVGRNEPRVTARHFRPNFVVRMVGRVERRGVNHVEDGWRTLAVDSKDLRFAVAGACARCSMVDVDPTSGMKGRTLQTLADYRRSNGQISFGVFLTGAVESPVDSAEFEWLSEGECLVCD